MFNGIVESLGVITSIQNNSESIHFEVTTQPFFDDLKIGDSIAINGVCLTVTNLYAEDQAFSVTAVPETLRLTNLGELIEGDCVNLERPLKMDSRIGGHFVQGHVDGIGEITEIEQDGDDDALLVTIGATPFLTKYMVQKGYVALDGMSITIVDVNEYEFTVTFIPHTQAVTIVKDYEEGTKINIEVDIMGKYIENFIQAKAV